MKTISLILIIFFLLVGQNIAEPFDTLSPWKAYQKAIKEVDENKTLTRDEKEKIKANLSHRFYYKETSKLMEEAENIRKEEEEIWKLIEKNNYTAAFQKVDEAKHIRGNGKFRLRQIMKLLIETDIPIPKDKIKALELKIKELELKIFRLEEGLEKTNNELELIDSLRKKDVSGIEIRLLNLEEVIDKP